MRRLNSEVTSAGIVLAASAVLFTQTFNVRNFPSTRFGAEIWPRFVIGIIAALAVIQLVQGLRKPGKGSHAVSTLRLLRREAIPIATFASFAAFVALLPVLGTPVAGFLLVFTLLAVVGPTDWRHQLRHVAIAAASVLGLWVLFTYVLHVIMPAGRWARWF